PLLLLSGNFPQYLGTWNRSLSVIMSNHYCTSMRQGTCLCLWLVLVNIALDHQQQIADISRLRKFNTSLPRSHFCGEKRCVMRQKETIMKQGVLRI
ncbi:unnamed protein product, partial [Porites evermanni]